MDFPFWHPYKRQSLEACTAYVCICFGLLSLNSVHDTVKLDTMHCLYHPDQVSCEKNPDTSVWLVKIVCQKLRTGQVEAARNPVCLLPGR